MEHGPSGIRYHMIEPSSSSSRGLTVVRTLSRSYASLLFRI